MKPRVSPDFLTNAMTPEALEQNNKTKVSFDTFVSVEKLIFYEQARLDIPLSQSHSKDHGMIKLVSRFVQTHRRCHGMWSHDARGSTKAKV
jgi:hypothetical protein